MTTIIGHEAINTAEFNLRSRNQDIQDKLRKLKVMVVNLY